VIDPVSSARAARRFSPALQLCATPHSYNRIDDGGQRSSQALAPGLDG